jgi:hypothetical protein
MENERDRRDLFAAFALMGYMASSHRSTTAMAEIAANAFGLADEMVKLSDQK